jgi:hypothetical protein
MAGEITLARRIARRLNIPVHRTGCNQLSPRHWSQGTPVRRGHEHRPSVKKRYLRRGAISGMLMIVQITSSPASPDVHGPPSGPDPRSLPNAAAPGQAHRPVQVAACGYEAGSNADWPGCRLSLTILFRCSNLRADLGEQLRWLCQ